MHSINLLLLVAVASVAFTCALNPPWDADKFHKFEEIDADIVEILDKLPGGRLVKNKKIQEEMIAMKDGTKLHTWIVHPEMVKHHERNDEHKYPTVMDRSPYGYGDMEWITDLFVPFGYVGVGQDMRGTEKSEGNFTLWHSAADDSRDLGDWIVAQPWSNGVIYTMGASADGLESLQTPKTNPGWLAGQYIIWASSMTYDIFIPQGAYKQKFVEDWLHGLDMPIPEVVNDNINTVYNNEMYSEYWKQIEEVGDDFKNIKFPSAFWAGWYDIFTVGTLEAWRGYNELSDPSVQKTSKLVVDPLGHCIEGAQFFSPNTFQGRTLLVIMQMFELFGAIGKHGGIPREKIGAIKNVTFYVMSSSDDLGTAAGQYWTSLETFPEFEAVPYYLSGDGTASTVLPSDSAPPSTTYKFDPADPIPTLGGNNLPASIGGSIPCGPLDQQSIDGRTDMVVFDAPKAGPEEIVMTGPVSAELYVSSDAVDTDFMVRVSDVYNDEAGTVRLLQDNAVRMRWRKSVPEGVYPQTPQYLSQNPADVYHVGIDLWNTSYVVPQGHNLRFVVQSSNNPRFSVNPNNGLLLNDPAYPGQNVIAQNTIHHSAQYPSNIKLPIVTGGKAAMPNVNVVHLIKEAYPHITDALVSKVDKWILKSASKNL